MFHTRTRELGLNDLFSEHFVQLIALEIWSLTLKVGIVTAVLTPGQSNTPKRKHHGLDRPTANRSSFQTWAAIAGVQTQRVV